MLQIPPARIGMREDEVDTPALLIDLDAFEFNLDTMAARLAGTGVKLRAHAKTHKSPVVAHQQIARGAVGQCVQKVAEAEALAWGGVKNILVSNEVVGADKLNRVAALARITTIALCADCAQHVTDIETAARENGVNLTVQVEPASDVRRPAILSRQRAAQAHHRGAADRHRWRDRGDAANGGSVAPAGDRLPDRGRGGDRDV